MPSNDTFAAQLSLQDLRTDAFTDLLPAHGNDERQQLIDAFTTTGIREPIYHDENGQVLDGRVRLGYAIEHQIDWPTVLVSGLTEEQKIDFIFASNTEWRGTTKRETCEHYFRRFPDHSGRLAATRIGGVSHTHANQIKGEMIVAGIIDYRDYVLCRANQRQPNPAPNPLAPASTSSDGSGSAGRTNGNGRSRRRTSGNREAFNPDTPVEQISLGGISEAMQNLGLGTPDEDGIGRFINQARSAVNTAMITERAAAIIERLETKNLDEESMELVRELHNLTLMAADTGIRAAAQRVQTFFTSLAEQWNEIVRLRSRNAQLEQSRGDEDEDEQAEEEPAESEQDDQCE